MAAHQAADAIERDPACGMFEQLVNVDFAGADRRRQTARDRLRSTRVSKSRRSMSRARRSAISRSHDCNACLLAEQAGFTRMRLDRQGRVEG